MKQYAALGVLALALATPAIAADGSTVFGTVCVACHQEGGTGAPGLAPPLVDAALWTILGDKAPGYVAGVLLGGLSGTIEAGGESYMGVVMPPQSALSDEELAAVGTYVLRDLNGLELSVTSNAVAALRSAVPSHKALRELRKGGGG